MTIRRFVQSASITGVALFMMTASASATVINYNTNASLFSNGLTALPQTSGAAASLLFGPTDTLSPNSPAGVPSNIDLGRFTLSCSGCGTQAQASGAFFAPFTLSLVVTDLTDGATGRFLGTSSGGTIFSDVSPMTVTWAPLQIGPGTNYGIGGVGTGNFGPTFFSTTSFTAIVAPNSGEILGRSTIQGRVDSNLVPEPMTFVLIGTGLVGLGLLRRKARKS